MIAVVDYKKGNLQSVQRALESVGAQVCITSDADVIAQASTIVLPGVGAFADAAATMDELGQTEVIRQRVCAGVPFLGICLGLHLMFEQGTEGGSEHALPQGLGLLPGTVDCMPREDAAGQQYKIPHVGWNAIEFSQAEKPALFADIAPGEYFYFTHSYCAPESDYTIATTTHSITFPCAVQYGDAAFGVQFHPEKSSDAGLVILRNFVHLAKEA